MILAEDTKTIIKEALNLHKQGKTAAAEKIYLQALEQSPDNTNALNLLGLLYIQTKDFLNAISLLKKATELKPCAYFYENLGIAYFNNNELSEAIKCYHQALEFTPDSFDVLFNLALTLKTARKYPEAIEIYEKAIEINPDSADAYFNLANAYERVNETEKAIKLYEKAYEMKIDYEWIEYFLAINYLKVKNFKDGWKFFESRPSRGCAIMSQEIVYKDLISKKPLWNGEPLADKTLFVYYDSAFGDSLMFVRYLPLLRKLCKKLLFKPQIDLLEFFKAQNFDVEFVDGTRVLKDSDFDYHFPLISAPFILKHFSEKDIPSPEGYLKADKTLATEYKQKYFNNDKFKIGIKWMGCAEYGQERIIPIEMFYDLFELENVQFYSLQKGQGVEELEKVPDKYNIIPLGDSFDNFSETAAAIDNLDLVICNDTSVAHLAGAMGKKSWILLPFSPNWRWHNDISYCTWYKNATLFKQDSLDNWNEVFKKVKTNLLKLLN